MGKSMKYQVKGEFDNDDRFLTEGTVDQAKAAVEMWFNYGLNAHKIYIKRSDGETWSVEAFLKEFGHNCGICGGKGCLQCKRLEGHDETT